jgi:urease accessory protein
MAAVASAPAPSRAGELSALHSVLQLSDSAFPSGRYTLSYGLEAFAQEGQFHGPRRTTSLLTLLSDSIRLAVAPADGVALACAHRAVRADGPLDLDLVTRADRRLTAVKLVREAREASRRTGRALLGLATTAFDATALADYAASIDEGAAPGNHAIVLGVLSACLGVGRLEALVGELYAFSAGWAGAAVRLGLLDHRAAQRLVHRVGPTTIEAAQRAVHRDVQHIASSGPLPDVMSMRHEQAELRLFAT